MFKAGVLVVMFVALPGEMMTCLAAPRGRSVPPPAPSGEPETVCGTFDLDHGSPILRVPNERGTGWDVYWLVFPSAKAEGELLKGLSVGEPVVVTGLTRVGGKFRYVSVTKVDEP